ncbi:MAG: Lrp/AsnC family transcriptional regulator [Gammaproteobacteria bacterium]|nr:Lrp/AsnC family transcriptional regulator [Gammaproteobacteria bacterium]
MYGLPIDDVDVRILTMLQADCTTSTARIADEVNLSNTPCYRRIKRLEKDGYIKQYRALLDTHMLGYTSVCFIKLKIRKIAVAKNLCAFKQNIVNHPNVSAVFKVASDFDFLLLTRFRNSEQFSDLMTVVSECKFCLEADYLLVTDEFKNDQRLELNQEAMVR